MLCNEKPSACGPICRLFPTSLLCCALLLCLDNLSCCTLTCTPQELLVLVGIVTDVPQWHHAAP